MKKRAEITTQQIVILVVLIASFAVILFFFSKLNFGSESQKEVCHNSVIMRAKTPGEMVPLNCQREYVCISMNNKCDKMTNAKIHKVKTEDEVYEVLAKELSDCWWMFGEGKIDYVGNDVFPGLYCSLCSQIAFDDSIKEIFSGDKFNKIKLQEYMTNANRTSGESYSEYLYGTNNLEEISGGLSFGEVNLNRNYYAMMGVTSKMGNFQCGVWGAITGAFIPGLGVITSFGCWWDKERFASAVMKSENLIKGRIIEGVNGRGFVIPTLIEANSEEYNSLGCKSITTLS